MVSRSSISCQFLSTLSLRRATRGEFLKRKVNYHFYPRSPCGERQRSILYTPQEEFISIHALLAESDWSLINNGPGVIYFYPRSPCGERPKFEGINFWQSIISIHALLAESDIFGNRLKRRTAYFYPRSPCGERPLLAFISPLSIYFYPRSPCGERPPLPCLQVFMHHISIHALLAESDVLKCTMYDNFFISIHALLAESDGLHLTFERTGIHFYPRSPCGERQPVLRAVWATETFLSTLSLRRATKPLRSRLKRAIISIHALLAESDLVKRKYCPHCGISIHALLAESDGRCARGRCGAQYFYPRSPCGERP